MIKVRLKIQPNATAAEVAQWCRDNGIPMLRVVTRIGHRDTTKSTLKLIRVAKAMFEGEPIENYHPYMTVIVRKCDEALFKVRWR